MTIQSHEFVLRPRTGLPRSSRAPLGLGGTGPGETVMLSSVTQSKPEWADYDSAITATFDKQYECGQFVTGDWFVVAPNGVYVTPTPQWDGSKHGAAVNPPANNSQPWGTHDFYSSASNAALSLPIFVLPGQSLVMSHGSAVGLESVSGYNFPIARWTNSNSLVWQHMVLTVLESPPPAGSFRPQPWSGSKTLYNINQIRWDRLPNLPQTGFLGWNNYVYHLRYARMESIRQWGFLKSSAHHAGANYGREVSEWNGGACLKLLLDYPEKYDPSTDAYKALLLLIQRGIDFAGGMRSAMANSMPSYINQGGQHYQGRKGPVVFAAVLLDDLDLLNPETIGGIIHASPRSYFQEDGQTNWGTCDSRRPTGYAHWASGIGSTGTPRCSFWDSEQPISTSLPDWNNSYRTQPKMMNSYYGVLMSAILTGETDVNVIALWDHDPAFEYADWTIDQEGQDAGFMSSLWSAVRHNYPHVVPLAER